MLFLFVFLSTSVFVASYTRFGSIYLVKGTTDQYFFKPILDPKNSIACGTFNESFETTGWDTLVIQSSNTGKYDDDTLSYASGYLEGILTQDRIWPSFINMWAFETHDSNYTMPDYITKYLTDQVDWINGQIKQNPSSDYWKFVSATMEQVNGMVDGYNFVSSKDKQISYIDFQVMNSPDLDDLKNLPHSNRKDFSSMTHHELVKHIVETTSCSGLVKIDDDFKDLWMGHTTWENPSTMNRIFKTYRLYFSNPLSKADSFSFPGYPGCVVSQDDIYSSSQQLLTLETTNNIWITSLWDLVTPQSLQSWMRVLIANRMGNCSDWMNIMSQHNSGTYNNQWLCLDLKLFTPGNALLPGTLYCGEQIPGYFKYEDVTNILQFGYFPSYNVPYFPEIYNKSGYPEILKQKPYLKPLVDYDECVRANIFRRDQSMIKSTEDMNAMMRYNDYLNDPLEFQVPAFAVAARYDLDQTNFTGICHMSTDSKVTSYLNWVSKKEKTWDLITSPTYGGKSNIPPFSWSTTVNCDLDWIKHVGQPDVFTFDWITYSVPDPY